MKRLYCMDEIADGHVHAGQVVMLPVQGRRPDEFECPACGFRMDTFPRAGDVWTHTVQDCLEHQAERRTREALEAREREREERGL